MIGYFRTDDEGDAYVIPEELISDFDKELRFFEVDYEQYIVGNEIHNLKIIMENNDE